MSVDSGQHTKKKRVKGDVFHLATVRRFRMGCRRS